MCEKGLPVREGLPLFHLQSSVHCTHWKKAEGTRNKCMEGNGAKLDSQETDYNVYGVAWQIVTLVENNKKFYHSLSYYVVIYN